jgi:hypothetical protein
MTQDPFTKLDNSAFPEPATEAAASATLRDHARALLAAVLDKTLPASLKEEAARYPGNLHQMHEEPPI